MRLIDADALPPSVVAQLWAKEMGAPEMAAELENDLYGLAAIAVGLALEVAPRQWRLTPETGLLLRREDFKRDLEARGLALPNFWFFSDDEERAAGEPEQQAIQPPDEGRRAQQIQYVLQVIQKLGYDSLNIPYGGRRKIKNECLENAPLFTSDGFDHCWDEGNDRGLWAVVNKAAYAKGNPAP